MMGPKRSTPDWSIPADYVPSVDAGLTWKSKKEDGLDVSIWWSPSEDRWVLCTSDGRLYLSQVGREVCSPPHLRELEASTHLNIAQLLATCIHF
jgi:hypothetical protein